MKHLISNVSSVILTTFVYLVGGFDIAKDGLSNVENMAEMNIKLPKKLIDALEQIKKKGE